MQVVQKYPYKKWLENYLLPLKNIKYTGNITPTEKEPFETRLRLFGYTQEDLKTIIYPMAIEAKESIGAMGNDTPLAVLSNRLQIKNFEKN